MKEKVLSVFIDESGDFGQYNPASPNYYVAMVLHNQEIDISKNIEALEKQLLSKLLLRSTYKINIVDFPGR